MSFFALWFLTYFKSLWLPHLALAKADRFASEQWKLHNSFGIFLSLSGIELCSSGLPGKESLSLFGFDYTLISRWQTALHIKAPCHISSSHSVSFLPSFPQLPRFDWVPIHSELWPVCSWSLPTSWQSSVWISTNTLFVPSFRRTLSDVIGVKSHVNLCSLLIAIIVDISLTLNCSYAFVHRQDQTCAFLQY